MVLPSLLLVVAACSASDSPAGLAPSDLAPALGKYPPIANMTVSPSSVSLTVGGFVKLGVWLKDSQGNDISTSSVGKINWRTSDTLIAKVDNNGVVTGKRNGVAVITAHLSNNSASATVTVGTGTTSSTTNITSTSSTTTTSTTSTTTATATLTSSEPLPGSSDRVLTDTRVSLQQATDITSALTTFGRRDIGGTFNFTTNYDGSGTHALRLDWTGYNGACADQGKTLVVYIPQPYPKHVIFTWKMRMGRTSTGGGIGDLNAFQLTNPNCGTGGNASRKVFLVLRDVPDLGSKDRMEYIWPGPAPIKPAVTSDDRNLRYNVTTSFDPQQHIGEVLTQTLELQAESVEGASDGFVRLWVNGVKMVERTGVAIGAEAFQRFQFPTVFNSPMYNQTEYLWDVVAWSPQ